MKSLRKPNRRFRTATAIVCVWLIVAQLFWSAPFTALAQVIIRRGKKSDGPVMPPDFPSMSPSAAPNGPSGSPEGTPGIPLPADPPEPPATNSPAKGKGTNDAPDEIEVSFQGANIDMVVQWLAQTSGKSVVKHPRVQCQLTIVSSKKVTKREGLNLVYRALALEGFSAIESGKTITIVPEGQEPKMSPALLDSSRTDIPQGRQKLVKIFSLKFVHAADLKDKVKAGLSDKGTVESDDRANQLIVTDYNDNLRLAAEMIKAMDTDKPGDVLVRVIALKNVDAQSLVKDVGPLYQKMNSKSPGEVIELSANDRANSLIVLSSKADYDGIEKLVLALDTDDAQEKVMRAFPLKNADATDVAKQLKDLVQNQDNSGGGRFFYFGGDSNSGNSAKKANFVADRRRNTIVVQGPPAAMDSIGKMIEELDEPVSDNALAPKIYPLKYVNAADIEDVLNELFLKKSQQQRPYWYFDDNPEQTVDRDVGRLYGKVRITSEPYSNAIIITSNSKENLQAVEDVLKELDQPSEAGESTFQVGLKFADAATVANSINILFAKVGSPALRPVAQNGQQNNGQQQTQQNGYGQQSQTGATVASSFDLEQDTKAEGYYPWLGGQPETTAGGRSTSSGTTSTRPVSDLVGKVRAVADTRSNSLLISANVHFFPQVLRLIEEMDAPMPQVMIESRIVEVSSDFLDQLGVRWSPNGSTFTAQDFDNSTIISSSGQYVQGVGGTTKANSVPNNINNPSASTMAGSLAGALTTLRTGTLNNTFSMEFLVQFLHEKTHATVLGSPQVNVRDNEMGKLFVGQQIPFITTSQTTDVGALNQGFAYKPVGVILEVTPHINASGDVSLRIHAESSAVVPGQTLFGGAIINTRYFKTDLQAKDGQTLVLGGIYQKQVSDTTRKTPILGDIPGIKWLFSKKDTTTQDVELIVFLRPRVMRNSEEANAVLEDVKKSAPLVRKWEEENAKEQEKLQKEADEKSGEKKP
jgi:type II secretion system protein D